MTPTASLSALRRALALGLAVGAAALALAACGGGSGSGTTTSNSPGDTSSGKVALTEDGSSLLYPLYETWVTGYAKVDPKFSSTSGADGSGTGISDAESGTTVLGASDAYLPPGTSATYPTLENIPMAISAQMINYNVPEIPSSTHLKLDGTVLAGMYQGTITNWDASQIKALNPGVNLPNLKVVPVHRSDSSGDTFLFSSYLADSDSSSFAAKSGPSTSISFPSVSGALATKGNSGMVASCAATKGCVAYIGISYFKDTYAKHLGEALLENKSGNFELPSPTTIHAEAAGFSAVPSDGTLSLIYGSASGGYPIINYEYIVVKTNQSSSTVASGVKAFLDWCINPSDGNSATYLDTVGFQPLPASARSVSSALISKIS
jgi:phosphate transport system substrate-binding protein